MKYSIIIPVYNAEETIERTVKSIEQNMFTDFEIILIDDCSKDASLYKCYELSNLYLNVRVFHNEVNRGVSYTRNIGLTQAVGEYVLFCDSDDWYEPDYITTFDKFQFEDNNLRMIISGYWNHDEIASGCVKKIVWTDNDSYLELDTEKYIKDLYDKTLLQQLWNKCFSRKLIEEYNIRFDESISMGEDTRFVLEYIQKTNVCNFLIVNRALYHYMRDQKGSLMYRVGYESVEETLKNLEVLYLIMGLPTNLINQKIVVDRQNQIALYAYLIAHNMGMRLLEKYRLTMKLTGDPKQCKQLFWENEILLAKEKIYTIFKK